MTTQHVAPTLSARTPPAETEDGNYPYPGRSRVMPQPCLLPTRRQIRVQLQPKARRLWRNLLDRMSAPRRGAQPTLQLLHPPAQRAAAAAAAAASGPESYSPGAIHPAAWIYAAAVHLVPCGRRKNSLSAPVQRLRGCSLRRFHGLRSWPHLHQQHLPGAGLRCLPLGMQGLEVRPR